MSKVASIFDTPLPKSPAAPEGQPAGPAENGTKPAKKKRASKKKMIDQLLREMSQEEDPDTSAEPVAKKGRKSQNNSSTSSKGNKSVNKSMNKSKASQKTKKKAKPGLKIKLQDMKKHKDKLRKSLDALKHSQTASATDLSNESLNGHSTPVRTKPSKKTSKKDKPKGPAAMPLPLDFTPSKVTVKQEPKSPKRSLPSTQLQSDVLEDSVDVGRDKFGWVIHPTPVDEFMATFWETKPLLIKRNDQTYYKSLLSRGKIDEMLRKHNIEYTKNLDITSYREGVRETHNPDGRALPPDVWSFYEEGCSIRMLNPQTYLPGVYDMNVKLQEFFHCMTGANFYLTPPNSQGFAPHYDDIEAFVLQVEGRKHWKLYRPRVESEILARTSSPNFTQDEIGTPILEVTLEPGDMLYFPRGFIHQASTVPGHHSLHVTMSVYQKNSWADLLEIYLPHALSLAAEKHLALRRGIPRDLHQHFGIVFSDSETDTRANLVKQIKSLVDTIFSEEAIDIAVDQLAKRFQHDALPPSVSEAEAPSSVYGTNYKHNDDGTVALRTQFTEKSTVRLLRRNVLRLINEEDKLRIYYHTDNSREYHQYEPNFLEVDQHAAVGVELLMKMYPEAMAIEALPVEDKIEFVRSLWEKGLVVVSGK